ncbi:MAG: prepilin-type N-terminal cleavage/methylation domain-containing protein [Verrucomicrobia bacterium]|nr:prepilin-type N-terminal cleavage/methylation domain-containing protein [Verrucomicrobiota bacterium]
MKTNIRNSQGGFTLVEIMIVVAIIGLLAAIAIPNFVKARTTAQQNSCIANLKQIDGAKDQWALEQKKGADAKWMLDDVKVYLRGSLMPACPSGGKYTEGANVGASPTCNIPGHTL